MAKVTYTSIERPFDIIKDNETYSKQDMNLIDNYTINRNFNVDRNYIEAHFYSIVNTKLLSVYDTETALKIIPGNSDNPSDVSAISINPEQLAIDYGFPETDVNIVYHFLNDLYGSGKNTRSFYVNQISQDRQEVLIYTDKLKVNTLINKTEELKGRLNDSQYFEEFWLNFGENDLLIVTNIDTFELDDKVVVALKLYEPLPEKYSIKDTVQLVEKISDSTLVLVEATVTQDVEPYPTLRQANFNVEVDTPTAAPTEYFSYDELFSYNNQSSNRELYSYIEDKSVDINIDYTNREEYIHFSSAEERLRNFKYKLSLIESYESSLSTVDALNTTAGNTVNSQNKYNNLINGILANLDHYEKYLYFESGSSSWPKTNSSKPYNNTPTNTTLGVNWFNAEIISASNFDARNYDVLVNTLPSYIREDTSNEGAVLFTHMIGQHFDNLWIYTKALTDKYDADNRVDVGVSKDLVKDAITSLGLKVYDSKDGSNDLFKYLVSNTYDSGSAHEVINTFITVPGVSADEQTTSKKDYDAEVYKRVYHNIPYLLKTKGTERGLRALINCFGIPHDFLKVKQFGGGEVGADKFYGYEEEVGELGKVRIETRASGSAGYVLTKDASIQLKEINKTQDIHRVEVGFSPSDSINAYIQDLSADTFNLDNYLGDPRNTNKDSYEGLNLHTQRLIGDLERYEIKDFVRILKFYDNRVFKMIKDFVPARASLDTGIIIKPHILNRSKVKSPTVTGTRPEYSASIDTAFITGSDGGVYGTQIRHAAIQKELEAQWPSRFGGRSDITYKPDFQNPTTANPGEITVHGTKFYHPDGNLYTFEDVYSSIWTPFEGQISTDKDFYLMFTSESHTERFPNLTLGGAHPHIVPIDYSPHGQNSWVVLGNQTDISASFTPLPNDVLIAGFTQEAETDLLTRFTNYTKPLSSIHTATTIYKQDIKTTSGTVRKWVEDESPKLNGELSGSYILVTDGELNRNNVFKQVNAPALNYDIVTQLQSSTGVYKVFTMGQTGASTPEAACLNQNASTTLYHDDPSSYPTAFQDNTTIYTSINGSTAFNGGNLWYPVVGNFTAILINTTGQIIGTTSVKSCSLYDNTAPVGYTAAWRTKKINAMNETAAPFNIYGTAESGLIGHVTASVGTNYVYKEISSVGSNYHANTIDVSSLPDGTVDLDVKLSDTAGNQGLSATANNASGDWTLSTDKLTTAPSGYSIKFVDGFLSTTDQNTNTNGTFWIYVSGISAAATGTLHYALTSTGAGSGASSTRILNGDTAFWIAVSSSTHTMNSGTVTLSGYIVDSAGNQGSTLFDTIQFSLVTGNYNVSTIQMYGTQNTQWYSINMTPNTGAWTQDTGAYNWITPNITSGTGDTSSTQTSITALTNQSSNNRTGYLYLRDVNGGVLDTLTINQYGHCVSPDTLITLSTGETKEAGDIRAGDIVRTKHEHTLELTNCTVIGQSIIQGSPRVKLVTSGNSLICSPLHRVYVDNKLTFIHAEKLEIGDILSGNTLTSIEEHTDGPVVKLTVEKAHTYISNGILSHNVKDDFED